MGKAGKIGNFRRSRGEEAEGRQLTAVAEANGVVVLKSWVSRNWRGLGAEAQGKSAESMAKE